MKVALYRSPQYFNEEVFSCTDNQTYFSDYIRVSEPLEVEFARLPPVETVAIEVSIIDANIAKITEEFAQRLDELKSRKQELLAITDERAA